MQTPRSSTLAVFLATLLTVTHATFERDGACPILALLPFTLNREQFLAYSPGPPPCVAFTHMASFLLGMDHFNNRIPTIVPELSNPEFHPSNCTVYFPTDAITVDPNATISSVADTQSSVGPSVKTLLDLVQNFRKPCVILGPFNDAPTLETSIVATGLEIPLITHGSTDVRLSSPKAHPFATRTTVDLHPLGEAVVSHLRHRGRTDYLAMIYVTAEYGQYYSLVIDNAAKESGFTSVLQLGIAPPYTGFEPNRGVRYAMDKIKRSGYRTIVVAMITEPELQVIAEAADEFGTNNGEYVWVFSGNYDLDYLAWRASQDEMVAKLVRGAGMVRFVDGFTWNEAEDPFLKIWRGLDETFANRVNNLNPIGKGQPGRCDAGEGYFQTVMPEAGAGFMYDSVIAAGMGACRAQDAAKDAAAQQSTGGGRQGSGKQDGSRQGRRVKQPGAEVRSRRRKLLKGASRVHHPPSWERRRNLKKKPPKAPLNPFLAGILQSDFVGATGRIRYGENKGRRPMNRVRDTLTYGVYNLRQLVTPIGNHTYGYFLTDIQQNGAVDGVWTALPDGPFIFADGTPNPPVLLRDPPEQNYLASGARIGGLILMSISLFVILVSVFFVWKNKKKSVILASQPIFLYLLALGAALMTFAILTISFDESYSWDEKKLDAACTATPWLISLGHIFMYSALFCKLWRINEVLQFRRRDVKVRQVLWPFVGLVLAAVIVLSIWTAVDPFTWVREVIDDETGESYGRCQSKNTAGYLTPLIVLMIFSTALTAVMAWKTKDVQDTFSESSWIFYTIFLQLQLLIIGIPVQVILSDSSANATYVGRVLLLWTFPLSAVLLMFGPKVAAVHKQGSPTRRDRGRRTQGVRVTGTSYSDIQTSTWRSTKPSSRESLCTGAALSPVSSHLQRKQSSKAAVKETSLIRENGNQEVALPIHTDDDGFVENVQS